jgi:hypothetical protein
MSIIMKNASGGICMLTTSLTYKLPINLNEIFSLISGIATENGWKIPLKGEKHYIHVLHEKNNQQIVFTFSNHLSFEQYQQIHNMIANIQQHIKGTIDDSNSLLGYLSDGRGAYIITNWNEWAYFIMSAKLKALEGQKVIVYNDKEIELGNGLLLDYKLNESACIYECTLITTFGERTFRDKPLLIKPTNKW